MTEHKAIVPSDPLSLLRMPFPNHQISKLPKESRKQSDERKNRVPGCMVWECPECGNAHHKDAVHLDYVGHAAATDRLLDADPRWTWEPVADPASIGLPTSPGGMWIKLTVDGASRYGYGCADGKTGGDAIKEIIGDAIRNAGMRFGMALDLWHKGALHLDDDDDDGDVASASAPQPKQAAEPATINRDQLAKLQAEIDRTGTASEAVCEGYKVTALANLNARQFAQAMDALRQRPDARRAAEESVQTSGHRHDFGEILDDEIPSFGAR